MVILDIPDILVYPINTLICTIINVNIDYFTEYIYILYIEKIERERERERYRQLLIRHARLDQEAIDFHNQNALLMMRNNEPFQQM